MFKELNISLNVPRENKNYSYECYQDSLLNAEFSKIPYSNLQSEDCKTTELDGKKLDEKNLNERNLKEENYKEENLKKDNCTSKNVENEKCSDENLENFNLHKESSNDENLDKVAKREVNSKKEDLNANEESGIKALVAYIKTNKLQNTMHKGVKVVKFLINCDEEGIRDVIKELVCNLANKWAEKEKIMNELLDNVKKMNLWNKVFVEDILEIVNEKFSDILKNNDYDYCYNNVVRHAVTRYSKFLQVLFSDISENDDRDNKIVESVVGIFIDGLEKIGNYRNVFGSLSVSEYNKGKRVFCNVLNFLREYGNSRKNSEIILNGFIELYRHSRLLQGEENFKTFVQCVNEFYKIDENNFNKLVIEFDRKIVLGELRSKHYDYYLYNYYRWRESIIGTVFKVNPKLQEKLSEDKKILDEINSQLENVMENVRKDIENKVKPRHSYDVVGILGIINEICPSLLEQIKDKYFGEIYYCIDKPPFKEDILSNKKDILSKIREKIREYVPFVYDTWAKYNSFSLISTKLLHF